MIVVNKEKCNGCGTCVDACPSEAIKLENEVAVINQDECTECGTCVDECPSDAITEE